MATNPFSDPAFGNGQAQGGSPDKNPFADAEFGKSPGLLRGAGDSAIALGTGVVSGVQSLANLGGADNSLSQSLGRVNDSLSSLESDARKEERRARAEKIKQAEKSGNTWEEVKANVGAFTEAPLDTTLNALGSSLPTLAMSLVPGVGQAAAGARLAQVGMGAAQGVGAVKGAQYDATKQQHLDAGVTPEQAAQRAAEAQAYSPDNAGDLALGGALGGLAGASGAEGALARVVARRSAVGAAEKAAPGILRGTATSALKEAPTEAIQGGQERLASNRALQREGFDTPTWEGVAGQAAMEGIAGGVVGGGFGAVESGGRTREQNLARLRQRLQGELDAQTQEDPAQAPAGPVPLLGNAPPDRLYAFPDGTVGRTGEVESYLATLPEDQRAEARARLMRQHYTEVNDPVAQQARRWWENYGDGQPAPQRPDYLAEVQQAVRTGTPFTTQQTVDAVRNAMEDAWLAQNVTADSSTAPAVAEQIGSQLQAEFEQESPEAATAAVDARVRTGRILAGLQNTLDAGASNTLQVISRLNKSLTTINEAPLTAEEGARVRRIVDAYMGFRGVGERAPLPAQIAPAFDRHADNAAMEALIPERPSQAMGLNPNAGPISRAAVTAVDGGATQNLFRQAVERIRAEKANGKNQPQAGQPQAAQADAARTQASAPVGGDGTAAAGLPGAGDPAAPAPGLTTAAQIPTTQEPSTDGTQTAQAQQATSQGPAQQPPATAVGAEVAAAANEAATSDLNDRPQPTQAQKEAGNYAKGHVKFDGLDLTVENPVGSTRSGVDPSGQPWQVTMTAHYGYHKRTRGADGDQVDVYLASDPKRGSPVFVFDQFNADGTFDEHKAVAGVASQAEAEAIYDAHFSDGSGPRRRRGVTAMPVAEFKTWAASEEAAKGPLQRQASAQPKQQPRDNPARRMRLNAWQTNPMRAFLGEHGIHSDLAAEFAPGVAERRKAMVPGFGPIFRRNGKQLDDLATLARDAGFTRDDDVAELYPLIERAIRGERIAPLYAEGVAEREMERAAQARYEDFVEQAQAEQDEDPFAPLLDDGFTEADIEAAGLRFASPDLIAQVQALQAQLEAAGLDPEDMLERFALQFPDLSEEQFNEQLQAAYQQALADAAQPRSIQAAGGPADRQAGAPGQRGQDGAVQTGGDLLTSPTRADIEAQQDRADAAARQESTDRQRAEQDAAAARERAEVARRSQAAADTFELGQDPMANLTGQQDIFGASQQEPETAAQPKQAAPRASQPKTEVIEDLGEKIGGARKDTARSTGARTAKKDDDRPAWARRFQISQVFKAAGRDAQEEGRWVITDSRNTDWMKQPKQVGRSFATREEAEAAVPLAAVSLKHRAVPMRDGQWEIWRDITDRKRVKVVDQTFASRDEAMAYMAQNAVAILETSTTFGEADLPLSTDLERVGSARRTGDVAGQDFMDAFGFRGVEFGNWNNQAERQQVMNAAYDGLLDLAEALNLPPKAISLNGDLALAFGARGHGLSGARAHYEPGKAVINLTKMNGAGALAHEWLHALDHYFGRQDGKASSTWVTDADGTRSLKGAGVGDMATEGTRGERSGMRAEIRAALRNVLEVMTRKAETYVEDTQKVDRFVGESRDEVRTQLDRLRADLAMQLDPKYYSRKNAPATAEQLAEFDTIAEQLVQGVGLETSYRPVAGTKSLTGGRWTNDALERLSTINKAVRGRTGFNAERTGTLDRLRGYLGRYEQRLKMLADAQVSTEKKRSVPTDFVMDARSLDQGRGTDYWTTIPEMAARAFQGYVEDKISGKGDKSPFLNHAPENAGILTPWGWKRPFPAGEERKAINAAFDKLVGEFKTRETEQGTAIFSRPMDMETLQRVFTPLAPLSVTETQAAVAEMVKGWQNGPRLRVVATPNELPSPAPADTRGQYLNGTAYLVASNHRSAGNVQRTLAHEAIAHYGLNAMLGDLEWRRAMANIQQGLERGDAVLLEMREQVRFAYRDAAGNFMLSPQQEADEIAARAVEVGFDAKTGEFRTGFEWVKRAYSRIAQFLRNLGFDVRFTNAELHGMLARAQAFLSSAPKSGEGLVVGGELEPAGALARSESTKTAFDSRIDALFAGEKATSGTRVLDRSDVMGLLGYPDVPLMLNERHLLDGLTNHPEMTAAQWKKVPGWLENPAAVYTDPSHPGRLTVIAPERIAGYPVVMAVEPNAGNPARGKGGAVPAEQLLVTVFAKTTGDLPALGYLAAGGRLLYADTKKAPVAWQRAGDIPRAGGQSSGAKRILTEKNLAGWRKSATAPTVQQAGSSDTGVAYARGPSPVESSMGQMSPAQEAAWQRVAGLQKVPTLKERAQQMRANLGLKLRQGIVDQFAPIRELDQRAYMLARMSKGSEGTMEAALLYGRPFLRDGVPDVDASQGGFAKTLASLKGEHDRFLWWVAAQRAERLKAEGKENLMTDQDIAALKSLNTGRMADGTVRLPVYANAMRDLNAFNESVLKMALDSGLIDKEAFDLFQGQPYVPFYRLMEEEGGLRGPTFGAGLTNQKAWQKLKGGSQQLNADLLQNMLMNWSHLYAAAARNRAAVATMDAAAAMDVAYQVDEGTKGAVKVMRDGRTEHWAVEDPYLLDAISSLHYAPSPLMKPLAKMKQLLTLGVTVNPTFKIRNLIRDSVSAVAQADLSYNPAKNVGQGWKLSAKDSQVYASMLASGGVIKFGTQENTDRLRAQVAKLGGQVLDKNGAQKLWGMVKTGWDVYQEFGDRTENVNRVALYDQLIKKGHSHAEASFMARDLMDFSMSGAFPVVRFLTQTVPFLNARLVGLDKLGRAAVQDPRRFAAVTGAVVLASLALMAMYQDDDDWKRREDWDRDAYWWFKVGDTAFRIPKPFEVGAIGTLAERTAELMLSDEMTGKRYAERLRHMLSQTFAFDPVPQAFKPLLDVYANRDSFTGREIESQADQRLRPQDRYGERTSEVAKLLGSWGLPDPAQLLKGEWRDLSPKQVDHLLRGYFSWMAAAGTTVSDFALRPALDRGDRPAMRLKDVFVVGSFAESLPTGGSRYVSQLYEQARAAEQAYASYREAIKQGDTERAAAIQAEEGDKLRNRAALHGATQGLAFLNRVARGVEANRNMSAEEKRQRLSEIEQRRHAIAQRARRQPA